MNHPSQRQAREFRRILMIRFGGIGDILMTTPTVRALKARYPDAQIDYLVNGGFRDVLSGHPAIRNVLEFHKRGRDALPHRFAAFLIALHEERYDLVVNLQPSVKTALMTWAAAPEQALMFHKDQTEQPRTQRRRHAINDFHETVVALDVPELSDRNLDFSVPSTARTAIERLLTDRGYSSEMRLVVLHPAANHRVNRWPGSHYAALCDTLARRADTFIVFTGHAKDAALCRSIRTASEYPDRCADFSGRLSLKELGALLERADAFVTGDTGPMHIASAVGAPLISLFGAADPDRTKPLAMNSRVLSDRSLPCVPCHARTCRFGREARCMQMLLPRAVIAAVDAGMRQPSQIGSLQTEAV